MVLRKIREKGGIKTWNPAGNGKGHGLTLLGTRVKGHSSHALLHQLSPANL